MEIQMGFRLNSVQELELLAKALQLVEDKDFKSYVTVSNNLLIMAEQEATLRKRIEELEKTLLPMVEFDKLSKEVERLKKEEEELKQRVAGLKETLARYQSLVSQLQKVTAEP
jgi:predicted ATP-grasp superfamily ATP-dependent carboligase